MSKEKYNVRTIPAKQLGEEPASENQISYLRLLTDMSESDLQSLGKWQASTLIDIAVHFRDSQSRAASGPSKSGVIGKIVILIVLLAGGWTGYTYITGGSTESLVSAAKPSGKTAAPHGSSKPVRQPAEVTGTPAESSNAEIPSRPAASTGTLTTLEGLVLPVQLLATEGITLRDPTGMEVSLPAETTIKVTSRSDHGTLSMEINGALFVGNESRIAGKVKLEK